MNLGELIKKARKANGLTLEELAEATSTSKSYIWGLENNKDVNPSIQHCAKLSLALGISVNSIACAAMFGGQTDTTESGKS